jgi:hypothetical protein
MARQPWAQGSGHRLAHHLQHLGGVERARLLLDLRQRLLLHLLRAAQQVLIGLRSNAVLICRPPP